MTHTTRCPYAGLAPAHTGAGAPSGGGAGRKVDAAAGEPTGARELPQAPDAAILHRPRRRKAKPAKPTAAPAEPPTAQPVAAEIVKPNPAAHLAPHAWQPGQSGNPGGRPKGFEQRVRALTTEGEEPVAFALSVMRGEPMTVQRVIPPRDGVGPPMVYDWKETPPPALRLDAAKWLIERGYGKPKELLEVASRPFLIQHRNFAPGHDPLADDDPARSIERPTIIPALPAAQDSR